MKRSVRTRRRIRRQKMVRGQKLLFLRVLLEAALAMTCFILRPDILSVVMIIVGLMALDAVRFIEGRHA